MQGRENIKGALVKPVMVNTRDGQIAIIVTYVSRSRHVSYLKTSLFVAKIHDDLLLFPVEYEQEKMRGQRGRLKALAGICYVHESYF